MVVCRAVCKHGNKKIKQKKKLWLGQMIQDSLEFLLLLLGVWDFLRLIFNYMMYGEGIGYVHMYAGATEARGVRSPEARVSSGCEPPDVSAENQTQVYPFS